jgi:hypothetical protein
MPKEFFLHCAVAVALPAAFLGRKQSTASASATDFYLLLALGGSLVSAIASATNPWWVLRESALTISSLLLFWICQGLGGEAKERLLGAAGLTVVVAAVIALLEARGLLPRLSIVGQMPGGVFGNRNFMAHGLVLGLPVLVRMILVTSSDRKATGWGIGLLIVASMVVVSRCRGAWLWCGVIALTALLVCIFEWRQLRRLRKRFAIVAINLLLGGTLSLAGIVANPWATNTPYQETGARLLDYRAGSGRGRIIQYATTLKMIAAAPLLGVGPGHWSAAYPRFALPGDPSWRPEALQPVNRFPNNDGLAVVSERGILTALFLLAAVVTFAIRVLPRQKRMPQVSSADGWLAIFTMLAAFLLGLTDSVLVRPEPLVFLTVVLGATSPQQEKRWRLPFRCVPLIIGATALSIGFAAFMGVRCYAVYLKRDDSTSGLQAAWALDRGDYVLGTYLARRFFRMHHCDEATEVALQVLRLYPHSQTAQHLLHNCQSAPLGRVSRSALDSQQELR